MKQLDFIGLQKMFNLSKSYYASQEIIKLHFNQYIRVTSLTSFFFKKNKNEFNKKASLLKHK